MINSDESHALFTYSLHKNNNHSDKDCRKQKELRGKKTAPPKFSNKPSDSFYSCSDQVYKINMWYVDSGASFHMTPDRTLFNAQEPSQGEILILILKRYIRGRRILHPQFIDFKIKLILFRNQFTEIVKFYFPFWELD